MKTKQIFFIITSSIISILGILLALMLLNFISVSSWLWIAILEAALTTLFIIEAADVIYTTSVQSKSINVNMFFQSSFVLLTGFFIASSIASVALLIGNTSIDVLLSFKQAQVVVIALGIMLSIAKLFKR
jgi:hypothetical protein